MISSPELFVRKYPVGKRLWQTGLLFVALILASCQSEAGPADPEQVVAPTEIVAADTPTVLPPTQTPLSTDAPVATLPPTAIASNVETEPPPTESPPTETPIPEPVVQINGRNPDGTYFRGRSDAPIVMIDYSDFF